MCRRILIPELPRAPRSALNAWRSAQPGNPGLPVWAAPTHAAEPVRAGGKSREWSRIKSLVRRQRLRQQTRLMRTMAKVVVRPATAEVFPNGTAFEINGRSQPRLAKPVSC